MYRSASAARALHNTLQAELSRTRNERAALMRLSAAHHLGYLMWAPAKPQIVVPRSSGYRKDPYAERLARPNLSERDVFAPHGLRCTTLLAHELFDGFERTLDVRSDGEVDLVDICRDFGLPIPYTNVMVHGWSVDAFYPEHGVFAEVDTYATHGNEVSFERDRQRITQLGQHGLRPFPVTTDRMRAEPALGRSGARSNARARFRSARRRRVCA